jgi:hypothetical protein
VATQAELAAAIRADRQAWRDLVAEVGPGRTELPGAMGDWTFRDVAGHLAGWRNLRIPELEAAARGEPPPPIPWPHADDEYDAINAWIRERDRSRSTEELIADYDGTFERVAAAIEGLPPTMIDDPNAFAFTDGIALADRDFTEHLHVEHEPALRAWLAGLPSD